MSVQAPTEIQAVWFRTELFTRSAAEAWCARNNFEPVEWRERVENDVPTHHIAVITQPDLFDSTTFRTIADDFPEGVSATIGVLLVNTLVKVGEQDPVKTFTFVMSTEDEDRDGDVIIQKGIDLTNFKRNPIALFGHNHDQPIGIWENIRVEGKRLLGELKLAAKGTSEFIDTLHALVEQRILRAVSVGFGVKEYTIEDGGFKFLQTELYECSLVSVPANAAALRAKAAKIVPSHLKNLLLTGEDEALRSRRSREGIFKSGSPQPGKSSATPAQKTKSNIPPKGRPMNVAERIRAKEARAVAVKDRLTELKSLLEADESYEFTDAEQTEIETLEAELESVNRSITTLKSMEASLASKAAPVGAKVGVTVPAKAEVKEKGGSLMIKAMSAHLVAHMTKQPVQDVIELMYPSDERVRAVNKVYSNPRRLLAKSATDAADTTTAGWAAELVQDDLRGFLEELRAVSIYGQLIASAGAQSLVFGGANTVTIPRRNRSNQSAGAATGLAAAAHLGHQIGGSWVGEGGVIPVKQMALSSQTLSRYKLAVIAAMTNEILEQSTPNIESIVRAAILEDTALAVDGALLDGVAAVAGIRPASAFAGAPNQPSAGTSITQIITDIKYLLEILSSINGASPVLIMNSNRLLGLSTVTMPAGGFMFRDEIAAGRLMGIPVLASTTVNPSTVGIIDAGSFVAANDAPAFAISDQATLTMANADGTAPTQAGDATNHTGGAIGTQEQVHPDGGIVVGGNGSGAPAGASVVGYSAQSMFQQYQTAIRMVMPASWGMIRTGAAAYLTGVAW